MSGGTPARPDVGFSRLRRLTRSVPFREAYDQNRKFVGRFMVMWLRSAPDTALRLGVVSSRKVGPAVVRNRARRRLREAWRRLRPELCGDVDVVIAARATLPAASWEALNADLRGLAGRAGLWRAAQAAGPESGGAQKA